MGTARLSLDQFKCGTLFTVGKQKEVLGLVVAQNALRQTYHDRIGWTVVSVSNVNGPADNPSFYAPGRIFWSPIQTFEDIYVEIVS